MSDEAGKYGPPCVQCGHPANYHGASFCALVAGSTTKRPCDCTGYNLTRGYVMLAAVLRFLDDNGGSRDEFMDYIARTAS